MYFNFLSVSKTVCFELHGMVFGMHGWMGALFGQLSKDDAATSVFGWLVQLTVHF